MHTTKEYTPTYHNHGKLLGWREPDAMGQMIISPVVGTFTHAGEEMVVVLWQPRVFAVISMATGRKVS